MAPSRNSCETNSTEIETGCQPGYFSAPPQILRKCIRVKHFQPSYLRKTFFGYNRGSDFLTVNPANHPVCGKDLGPAQPPRGLTSSPLTPSGGVSRRTSQLPDSVGAFYSQRGVSPSLLCPKTGGAGSLRTPPTELPPTPKPGSLQLRGVPLPDGGRVRRTPQLLLHFKLGGFDLALSRRAK